MIEWIMQLFISGNTTIKINGEVGPHFRSSCGVRQGHPFPLLYNSTIDSLEEILDKSILAEGLGPSGLGFSLSCP